MSFDTAIQFILRPDIEGGFQNRADDPGNWTGGKVGAGALLGTKFGISAASYPSLDIANLTQTHAIALYHADFWLPIGGAWLAPGVDLIILDCAVNQGPAIAVRLAQAAAGVHLDGKIGPVTGAAARGVDFLQRFATARVLRYSATRGFADNGEGWIMRTFKAYAAAAAWF